MCAFLLKTQIYFFIVKLMTRVITFAGVHMCLKGVISPIFERGYGG